MISRPTDFSDYVNYTRLLTIWHNQQNQDDENKRNHDNYITASANWLIQATTARDAGKPLPQLPFLPMSKTYNDDGTVTATPFPDLVTPQLLPVSSSSGSGKSNNPPLDREDQILIILNKICNFFQIK